MDSKISRSSSKGFKSGKITSALGGCAVDSKLASLFHLNVSLPHAWHDPLFNLGLDDISATFQERNCFLQQLPLLFILRKGLNTPSDQAYRHAKVKPLHAPGQTKNKNTHNKQKQMASVAGNEWARVQVKWFSEHIVEFCTDRFFVIWGLPTEGQMSSVVRGDRDALPFPPPLTYGCLSYC